MVKKKRVGTVRERNSWTMSEAEFKSSIISALRKLSSFWKPINKTKSKARVSRGIYRCEKCWKEWREYSPAPPWKKRRVKEFAVDHFIPTVWEEWFTTYDDWIRRTFIEEWEWLRLLCKECHDGKTKTENAARRAFKWA